MEVGVELHAHVVGHHHDVAGISRLPGTRRQAAIDRGRHQARFDRGGGQAEGAGDRGRRRRDGEAVHDHPGFRRQDHADGPFVTPAHVRHANPVHDQGGGDGVVERQPGVDRRQEVRHGRHPHGGTRFGRGGEGEIARRVDVRGRRRGTRGRHRFVGGQPGRDERGVEFFERYPQRVPRRRQALDVEAFGEGRGRHRSEVRRGRFRERRGLAGYPLEATRDQAVFPAGPPVQRGVDGFGPFERGGAGEGDGIVEHTAHQRRRGAEPERGVHRQRHRFVRHRVPQGVQRQPEGEDHPPVRAEGGGRVGRPVFVVGPAVHRAITGGGNGGGGCRRRRAERSVPGMDVGATPGRGLGD